MVGICFQTREAFLIKVRGPQLLTIFIAINNSNAPVSHLHLLARPELLNIFNEIINSRNLEFLLFVCRFQPGPIFAGQAWTIKLFVAIINS